MRSVNYKGYEVFEDGSIIGLKGTLLKPGLSSNGYYTVCIYSMGKSTSVPIHRLIALCFIPNPENKAYINHINSIRTDNSIKNLEWCTPTENAIHMVKNGRITNTINSIRKRMSKPVIDTHTGITYTSCVHAASELGVNESGLRHKLCGSRKNNTTLNYIKQ